jgi:hypothetical protein
MGLERIYKKKPILSEKEKNILCLVFRGDGSHWEERLDVTHGKFTE